METGGQGAAESQATPELGGMTDLPPGRPPGWPVWIATLVAMSLAEVESMIVWNSLGVVQGGVYALTTAPMFTSMGIWELTILGAAVVTESAYRGSNRPMADRLGWRSGRVRIWDLVFGVLLVLSSSFLIDGLLVASGLDYPAGREMAWFVNGISGSEFMLLLIVGSLAPGVCEEVFFRGLVLPRLAARHGALLGVVLSAALFGLVHRETVPVLGAAVTGLSLGWLALRSGTIVTGVIAHLLWNLCADLESWLLGPPLPTWTTWDFASAGAITVLAALALKVRWARLPPSAYRPSDEQRT